MDALKAAAGQNDFGADKFVARFQKLPQVGLLFGIGREIGVARFGGHGGVTLAVPEQNALAEAGARGDYDLRGLGASTPR